MAELLNTFENTVANGDPISVANSDTGTAGDPFVGVTNTVVQADTDITLHDSKTAQINLAASGIGLMQWDPPATTSEAWYRMYFRVSAMPPGTTKIVLFDLNTDAPEALCDIRLTDTDVLHIRIPTTAGANTSAALSIDTWYRLEIHVKINSTTDVLVECRLFYGANLEGSTPDESFSNNDTSGFTLASTNINRASFGLITTTGQAMTMNLDSLGYSDVTWPGSVVGGDPGVFPIAAVIGMYAGTGDA